MNWSVTWEFEELGIEMDGVPGIGMFAGEAELEKETYYDDFFVSSIVLRGDGGRVVAVIKQDQMWLWNRIVTAIYASDQAREFFFERYSQIAA